MQFISGRYNAYSDYLKTRFGGRVHKIPVHAGFTCPNRDGTVATGGCTYCNIDSFTREGARARIPIRQQIDSSIEYFRKRYKANKFIVYFQPYSNTYAPLEQLVDLYEQALYHPDIIGISVGTRADCIDNEKLAYFAGLANKYLVTIEYGIESVFDETLRLINRGHDYACTVNAIQATAAVDGINVCGHIILGFPHETREQMLTTVKTVARLPLDFIKLHNLHIVRYTDLARQYAKEPFHIFTFDEWIDMVCDSLERLNPEFIVERLHGEAHRDILIEPAWCKDGAKILYAIQNKLEARNTCQGKYFTDRRDPFSKNTAQLKGVKQPLYGKFNQTTVD